MCQIATAKILIDDFNDHTPKFDHNLYTFRIENFPYNNTEVGTLKAGDKDKVNLVFLKTLDGMHNGKILS